MLNCITLHGLKRNITMGYFFMPDTSLKRTFGSMREEVAGGWTRLHNEELRNFYASPYTVRVIKSRG